MADRTYPQSILELLAQDTDREVITDASQYIFYEMGVANKACGRIEVSDMIHHVIAQSGWHDWALEAPPRSFAVQWAKPDCHMQLQHAVGIYIES